MDEANHEVTGPTTTRRWALRDFLLLGGILLVGLGFRIARCGYDNLVYDEMWQIETSSGRGSMHDELPLNQWVFDSPSLTSLSDAPPWYTVWTHVTGTVHPPLYYTLLRLWREAWGPSDTAARAFSIFCSMIAIALVFVAARESFGLAPAAWGALLLAVAPPQYWLAQQVRDYALLMALTTAAVLVLIRLETTRYSSTRAGAALGVFVLLMMLTHYFASGAAIAIGIYVLIRLRGASRRSAIIGLSIAAVVYAGIWGPFAFRQYSFAVAADQWLVTGESAHAVHTLKRALTWPWYLAVADLTSGPLQYLAVAVFVAAAWAARRNRQILIWFLWLACYLAFVAVLDLTRQTTHLRYLRYASLAAPPAFVLIPVLAGYLGRAMGHLLPAMLAVAAVASSPNIFVKEEPGYPELGRFLDQNAAADEPLIFHSGDKPWWYVEVFHLATSHYSHLFPRTVLRLTQPAPPPLMMQSPNRTAWLISGNLRDGVEPVIGVAKVIEQRVIEGWIVCTHVELQGNVAVQ